MILGMYKERFFLSLGKAIFNRYVANPKEGKADWELSKNFVQEFVFSVPKGVLPSNSPGEINSFQ